jgi:hypothetical protein
MPRVLPLILILACKAPEGEDPFVSGGGTLQGANTDTSDSGDTSDTGGHSGPLQSACESGEEGEISSLPTQQLSSTVTWTLEFDEEGEGNGFTDCTYSREYAATEQMDLPWLCGDFDAIFEGTATMTEGLDCYSQIVSEPTEERTEMWGISSDTLYRSGASQAPMGELTTFEAVVEEEISSASIEWSGEYELTDGGMMVLSAAGSMEWWTDPELLTEDPWGPRAAAYACEWECNDPGTLEPDYDLALGDTLPNARLEDACGERVDLWDFYGSYIVMDSSQSDCGPCRSMAEQEHDFVQQMRDAGIPVRVVTMLGNGLADPYGTPDQDTLDEWVDTYDLTEPVLKDRGFTYALFPSFLADEYEEDYGFPAWIIVDPEMKLIFGNVGFSSWDDVAEAIQGDWEER